MMNGFPTIRVVHHSGHDHEPIHSCYLRGLGGVAGILRRKLCHSVEHRDPAIHNLHSSLKDFHFFLQRQGAIFPDRSKHDYSVYSLLDQGIYMLLSCRKV